MVRQGGGRRGRGGEHSEHHVRWQLHAVTLRALALTHLRTALRSGRDGEGVFTVRSAADRYVLFEAEEQGFVLPSACRMGCCTACAVRVKSGALSQPQALGLSAGLRREGYALLCVAFADQGDVSCELQDPDEVYEMQFGDAFAALATDKNAPSILRDDLALEIAAGDE